MYPLFHIFLIQQSAVDFIPSPSVRRQPLTQNQEHKLSACYPSSPLVSISVVYPMVTYDAERNAV